MRGLYLLLIFIPVLFKSCMDDDAWYEHNNYDEVEQGVFVVNEGNFMYDNASLSYYQPDSMQVFNDVFSNTNEALLGDVAQSMIIRDSLGYVVINNSGKIYVINTNTFEFVGKITGLTSPRYMHMINETKAYVTDIYGQVINIVNPLTYDITGTIDVDNHTGNFYQHATEQMVQYQNLVFVNCWSYDEYILVIDTETDQWIDSIRVPIQPRAMVKDHQQQIWVITDGGFAGNPLGHEQPALVRIDPASREIVDTLFFDSATSPVDMAINKTGDTLYYINGDVYRYPVDGGQSPELFIESPYDGQYDRGFSALGIDPANNDIYLADAIDNVQRGLVYRYRPTGIAVDTFRTGIIPTSFCFK